MIPRITASVIMSLIAWGIACIFVPLDSARQYLVAGAVMLVITAPINYFVVPVWLDLAEAGDGE